MGRKLISNKFVIRRVTYCLPFYHCYYFIYMAWCGISSASDAKSRYICVCCMFACELVIEFNTQIHPYIWYAVGMEKVEEQIALMYMCVCACCWENSRKSGNQNEEENLVQCQEESISSFVLEITSKIIVSKSDCLHTNGNFFLLLLFYIDVLPIWCDLILWVFPKRRRQYLLGTANAHQQPIDAIKFIGTDKTIDVKFFRYE